MSRRRILITGCSTGIGRALAEEFHRRGHQVYATARRLESLGELKAQGLQVAELDVNDAASIDALMQQLRADGVPVDLLINNAGYGAMGPLVEMPLDEVRRQFETNVTSIIALTQAVVPGMIERRSGLVINIGSVSGVLVTPFAGAYCASKAAVHALSDALRMELAPFGIQVMVVQPGAIRSQFGATASAGVSKRGGQASFYAKIADAIAARANASQQHSTPAEDFARELADAALAARPPALIRIGNGSRAMPLLQRWLPASLRDRVLRRRFKLDRPL